MDHLDKCALVMIIFSFNICIGDWGGTNANNTWTIPLVISYAAPPSSIYVQSTGGVIMPNGHSSRDQRIKTNIKTI